MLHDKYEAILRAEVTDEVGLHPALVKIYCEAELVFSIFKWKKKWNMFLK